MIVSVCVCVCVCVCVRERERARETETKTETEREKTEKERERNVFLQEICQILHDITLLQCHVITLRTLVPYYSGWPSRGTSVHAW